MFGIKKLIIGLTHESRSSARDMTLRDYSGESDLYVLNKSWLFCLHGSNSDFFLPKTLTMKPADDRPIDDGNRGDLWNVCKF